MGWPARWNRARLRARADRAERRAAVAMNKASVALSDAFEAVLQAACARIKADEACRNITETPDSAMFRLRRERTNFNPRKTPSVRTFE